MLEQIFSHGALTESDVIWLSLGPLLAVNILFLLTLAYFGTTYSRRPRHEDVDLKEHTRFLSSFLKEYWYWLIGPVEKLILKLGIRPNTLTFIGFLLSLVAGFFFYLGRIGLGGWFMIFGATLDVFDGRIARLTGQKSDFGAFFDSVMDRFGEAVVLMGLSLFYRDSWVLYFVLCALVGSMMVSYTRARGEGIGIVCSKGIMQRPERIVYLGCGSIFSPIFAYLISFFYKLPYDFMTIGAIILIGVLSPLSAIFRMRTIQVIHDSRK